MSSVRERKVKPATVPEFALMRLKRHNVASDSQKGGKTMLKKCAIPALALLMAAAGAAGQALAQKADRLPVAPVRASAQNVQDSIAAILGRQGRLPHHLQRHRKALTQHYVTNAAAPYWLRGGHMKALIHRLRNAHADGLNPGDYLPDYLEKLRKAASAPDPMARAYVELTFTTFFLHYASDLNTGRFVPRKIDPRMFLPHRRLNEASALAGLNRNPDTGRYLDSLQPRNPHYRALRALLPRYRRIVASGGWGVINPGPVLKPGASDARIPAIRDRLMRSGDLAPYTPGDPQMYDAKLAAGVKAFQRRHGLNDEGIIGKLTLIQMNIPARERLRQIIVNMERWRWMPQNMGRDHIMVNIAAFELDRTKGGRLVERIPVIVGKKYHETPIFSRPMRYIVFNPTWTVPQSIASKEMLPKLQADPFHYAAQFDVLQGGRKLDWSAIDWTQYRPGGRVPFTFRQKPGPKNALGMVKFMLPNKHSIYLHDTPSRGLFARQTRAFSHGCIRVYKPLKLAASLLAPQGWTPARISAVIASGETTKVGLKRRLPVHILYATSFARDGKVQFRPDIYGRDRKLYNAIFARPTS